MKKMEFLGKNLVLEQISDIITNILRMDGYDQISVETETNSQDREDRLFRIVASKKGAFGNSTTRRPPIKFQIRGKPNHILIAQQWDNDHSDTVDAIMFGIQGLSLGVIRSFRRKKLEKKYWNLMNQEINSIEEKI